MAGELWRRDHCPTSEWELLRVKAKGETLVGYKNSAGKQTWPKPLIEYNKLRSCGHQPQFGNPVKQLQGKQTGNNSNGALRMTTKTKDTSITRDRPVLVTTKHRGVFFGYAASTDGETIKLRAARCCLYWPTANKGFLGLASMGPLDGARVGPAADIDLRDITCVAECTADAVKVWEAAPWK